MYVVCESVGLLSLCAWLYRAHCQQAIKKGHGWDFSREGRMPDASNSSHASAPEGALTTCVHPPSHQGACCTLLLMNASL